MSRLAKIRVEILRPNGMKPRKCEIEGKYIIIKRGKGVRGDPTIKAGFSKDSIIYYETGIPGFKRLKQKVLWVDGHKDCVAFKGKTGLSYFDVAGFFEAGAIRNAGRVQTTLKIPFMLYVALMGMGLLILVNIFVSSGRLYL